MTPEEFRRQLFLCLEKLNLFYYKKEKVKIIREDKPNQGSIFEAELNFSLPYYSLLNLVKFVQMNDRFMLSYNCKKLILRASYPYQRTKLFMPMRKELTCHVQNAEV